MSQLVIFWQPAAVARHCRHVGVVGCGPDNRRANKKNDHNTRVIIIIILFRLEEEEKKRGDRVVWVLVILILFALCACLTAKIGFGLNITATLLRPQQRRGDRCA